MVRSRMDDEQLSLVRGEGGVAVVKLRGEHDLSTAQAVRSALRSAVESGPPAVVVDLSDTTFLDSSILGALIGAYRVALPVRGELEDAIRAVGEQSRAS